MIVDEIIQIWNPILSQKSKLVKDIFSNKTKKIIENMIDTMRAKKVIIEAFDEQWKNFILKADWLLSRVIQHEYDHLDWIEFTEKITDIKKIMSSEEYIKIIVNKQK